MPSEKTKPPPPKYLQQEETLSQECNNLISSLPKHKGWLANNLYQYQGFWYPARYLQGVTSCQKNFQVQESDIFLVTTPKSGTTWLKALIFATVNRTLFPTLTPSHPLTTNNPHVLVPFLEIKLYADSEKPDLSSFAAPRIFSTHLPYDSLPEPIKKSPDKCKIVYLCRDPKDIFVSLWHFTNKLKPGDTEKNQIEEVFDMFCKGITLFGPLWDHILGYWNKSRDGDDCEKVLFLKYEDMKEQPGACLRRIAKFLNCPFSDEEERSGLVEEILDMCSFDSLSSFEVNKSGKLSSGEENNAFFRRGVVGDWKNYLSAEMVERLNKITEEEFLGSGLVL